MNNPPHVRTRGAAGLQAAERMTLGARAAGVLIAPRSTFEVLRRDPCWLDVLLLVAGAIAAYWIVLVSTAVGRQALVDQLEQQFDAYGIAMSDAKYRQIEQLVSSRGYLAGLVTLGGTPVALVLLSAIVSVTFGARHRGIKFRQVLSVVSHSGVVLAVHRLIAIPVTILTESTSSPTNLAALLPLLDEASFLARMLGAIDLFMLWWIAVLALGLAVLFDRPTRPIALSLWATYGAVAALVAVVIVWRRVP